MGYNGEHQQSHQPCGLAEVDDHPGQHALHQEVGQRADRRTDRPGQLIAPHAEQDEEQAQSSHDDGAGRDQGETRHQEGGGIRPDHGEDEDELAAVVALLFSVR